MDLLNCDKTIGSIIEVAERHTIDAADASIRDELNLKRVRELSRKHRLTENQIRKGMGRGYVITAEDYELCDIASYGDWAEYEYDIRGDVVFFRPLLGTFPESIQSAETFRILTPGRAIEQSAR